MKSCFAAAIILVIVGGCGGKPAAKQNVAGESAQTAAPVEVPADTPIEADLPPESPTPTIAEEDRPNSIDEFKADVFRRYQDGMYAPFVELTYWGSATEEQKKEYLNQVRSAVRFFEGKTSVLKSIDDIEVFPIGDNENVNAAALGGSEDLPLFPKPTHFVRITWHSQEIPAGATEDFTTSRTLPVGIHDGKYYFCTIKRD